jgi:hypothetical protein
MKSVSLRPLRSTSLSCVPDASYIVSFMPVFHKVVRRGPTGSIYRIAFRDAVRKYATNALIVRCFAAAFRKCGAHHASVVHMPGPSANVPNEYRDQLLGVGARVVPARSLQVAERLLREETFPDVHARVAAVLRKSQVSAARVAATILSYLPVLRP